MKTPGDHALRQADRAAKRGDLAGAERWTKVATLNQKQWEQFQARPPVPDDFEEVEAIRAEFRRRLSRLSAFDDDVSRWEVERDVYIEMANRALESGTPMPPPLRPHPAGGEKNTETRYAAILTEPEPTDGS